MLRRLWCPDKAEIQFHDARNTGGAFFVRNTSVINRGWCTKSEQIYEIYIGATQQNGAFVEKHKNNDEYV